MNLEKIIDIIEKEPEIYEILKYCPYEILKQFSVKEFPKGKFILNQGQVYDTFYIIVYGFADIYVMSDTGKKYSLTIYKKGNYIGEHEIFERKPYSCFVEAVSDIKLLTISRDNFLKWISLDKHLNEFITKTLCRQFYKLSKKVGQDTLCTLKERICCYLADNLNNKDNKVNINKENLSEQMAVTQRSVNRVLRELKEQDLIEIYNNYIIVKDLPALKLEADILD